MTAARCSRKSCSSGGTRPAAAVSIAPMRMRLRDRRRPRSRTSAGQSVGPRQQRARIVDEGRAVLRQHHVARGPQQQRRAERGFEQADVAAQRRRQHVEPARRPAEVQFLGDGHEAAKLMQVHPPAIISEICIIQRQLPPAPSGRKEGGNQESKGVKTMSCLRRALLTGALVAASATLATAPVLAQSAYPSKPITLVVPAAAGGPTDTVARLIAESMTQDLRPDRRGRECRRRRRHDRHGQASPGRRPTATRSPSGTSRRQPPLPSTTA